MAAKAESESDADSEADRLSSVKAEGDVLLAEIQFFKKFLCRIRSRQKITHKKLTD